eukprot:15344049-Ditylum_brightwellii.AAC.1
MDFAKLLDEKIQQISGYNVNEGGGYVCKTQDSDFPALVGPSCLLLRNLRFKQDMGKNKGKDDAMSVTGIEIGGGCNVQCQKIKDILTSRPYAQNIQWKKQSIHYSNAPYLI